jgi:hypothetical protein
MSEQKPYIKSRLIYKRIHKECHVIMSYHIIKERLVQAMVKRIIRYVHPRHLSDSLADDSQSKQGLIQHSDE